MTENIEKCRQQDFDTILTIINEAAEVYRGVIPDDCFHDPYMPADALRSEIAAGILFWGLRNKDVLTGIMGIQDVKDVTLIRHAYIRPSAQRRGTGSALLRFLYQLTDRPILIGTWRAAEWAIDFYRKHGFEPVPRTDIAPLLRRYWTVPANQIENSVVLAQNEWLRSIERD